MKLKSKYFNKSGLFLCSWICFAFIFLWDSASAGKFEMTFSKSETSQRSNDLGSNMLRIFNGSEKPVSFRLELNIPSGWRSLNGGNNNYKLDAGDSLFIPVKLLFRGVEEGDISYLVIASLISESNNLQFASATWSVQIIKQSSWSAAVDKTESYFINNTDTSSIQLTISNTGNSPELLSVKVVPQFQLQVFNQSTMTEITNSFTVALLPGKDTVITFLVKQKKSGKDYYQSGNPMEAAGSGNEKIPVRISILASTGDNRPGKIWKSTVNFRKSTSEVKYNEYSSMVLPLTVEMKLDNVLESATVLNFNLYGDARLSRSRSLSYRFQSFFTDQYFNRKAYRGNYHYIGYFTPKVGIEAGNITGWGSFGQMPSGVGAKGQYTLGKNTIGLMYIQNPDLFLNPSVKSTGIRHELKLRKLALVNYYQRSWNDFLKTNNNLYISGIDFRIRHQHLFSLMAGFSNEKHNTPTTPFTKNGVGSNFNYSGTVRKFSFRFSTTFGSKYYTGYQGIFGLNYGINYRFNKKYTLSYTNSFYQQQPVYFDLSGNEITSYKTNNQRYELRLGITDKGNNYSIVGAYYYDNLFSIRYVTRGLGLDYRPATGGSQVRFFSSIFTSFIKLTDYDIPDYFTAQVRASLRYKNFTANFRYNYGPYQAFEQLQFATLRINHQSFYANLYYGLWLIKHRLSIEPAINLSHETLYKRNRLSIRPQLFYFSKSGLEFSLYADYLVNSQKIYRQNELSNFQITQEKTVEQNLLIGVGLKKQFGIPIPGKKFSTITVSVFKDLNGNNIQDKNEESLKNILVTIKPQIPDTGKTENEYGFRQNGDDLITNEKGQVTFRNMMRGNYIITTKSLTENLGWFTSGEMLVLVNKSKEIAMPYSQGVRLTGSLLVDHSTSAASRNKNPGLSRIRITAADSTGKTYSALTDETGKFLIFVPAGEYRVSLNAKAIDDNFIVEQPMIPMSLSGKSGSYHISFQLKERERKVSIKKFRADGTVIQETSERIDK